MHYGNTVGETFSGLDKKFVTDNLRLINQRECMFVDERSLELHFCLAVFVSFLSKPLFFVFESINFN